MEESVEKLDEETVERFDGGKRESEEADLKFNIQKKLRS